MAIEGFRGHTSPMMRADEVDPAERQWKDMLKKIGGVGSSRSKDKMKGRTKEFERLLSFVEDARKCRGLIDCLTHELSSKSSRY